MASAKPDPITPGALCANCINRPATHHGRLERGGPLYQLCDACEQPAREGHGIERGYEPSGGFLTAAEVDAAARRTMGDARYERDSEINKVLGQRPAPARDPGEAEVIDYDYETRRRIRTRAADRTIRSSREKKLW